MRKLYSYLVCMGALLMPYHAHATMPVVDYAALLQLGNHLVQLKQQTQYIQQELQRLRGDQYQWSNAQGLINQLGSIIQRSQGLAYSASNIHQQFQQAYPGYHAPQNFNQQYQNNINRTQNTLDGVLQAMGTSAQAFQNENTRLAFLQQQARHAQGQTQAIQASSQIASEMVSQLQLLRQTMMAQTNAQTAYYAMQVQNEASHRAELGKVLHAGAINIPKYGTSGHPLHVANF